LRRKRLEDEEQARKNELEAELEAKRRASEEEMRVLQDQMCQQQHASEELQKQRQAFMEEKADFEKLRYQQDFRALASPQRSRQLATLETPASGRDSDAGPSSAGGSAGEEELARQRQEMEEEHKRREEEFKRRKEELDRKEKALNTLESLRVSNDQLESKIQDARYRKASLIEVTQDDSPRSRVRKQSLIAVAQSEEDHRRLSLPLNVPSSPAYCRVHEMPSPLPIEQQPMTPTTPALDHEGACNLPREVAVRGSRRSETSRVSLLSDLPSCRGRRESQRTEELKIASDAFKRQVVAETLGRCPLGKPAVGGSDNEQRRWWHDQKEHLMDGLAISPQKSPGYARAAPAAPSASSSDNHQVQGGRMVCNLEGRFDTATGLRTNRSSIASSTCMATKIKPPKFFVNKSRSSLSSYSSAHQQ